MKDKTPPVDKVIIDTGIFDRELLEKVCREIKQNKEKSNNNKSA